jgi:sigma-54 dependent transcriptional regulator, acetoin dehydrogenase operon transcriptional activator AcoR
MSSVRERWERVARSGLRADSPAYPIGTSNAELATRRDRLEDVFRDEHAILDPLAAQLAARALVAIVADAEGVILSTHGDGELVDPSARVRLCEGAQWSETARGTNAIGTAIIERRPVAVIGGAHYEERNQALFCYATPIHDSFGDLVAVLDVSGPIHANDPAIGVAVQAAGSALEQALRAVAYARVGAGALATIERLVQRCGEPAFVVEANGVVSTMNTAARTALPQVDGPVSCARLFGVPYAELEVLALRGGRDMSFETASGTYRVALDPIISSEPSRASGRTLAIVVYLELVRRAAPPPPPRPQHPAFAPILSADDAMEQQKRQAARFAATELPVLLLAETGTGKELFARAIHAASARAAGPFVPLNCGSLAPTLLEAELFGYAPGAFTGASRAGSDGRLGAAHGGTLFLDEVAEMPDALQAALLRVLDDGVYHRVGESRPCRADFRLVCATCRDLPELVERGAFRRDLFFRIHGACITIPALRDRSDRAWLARALLHSLGSRATLGADAQAWIREHDWPGNVRELKSALVHALALADDAAEITRAHFPTALLKRSTPPSSQETRTREQVVHAALEEAVRASHGNLSEAARRLGIARSTLYRGLKKQ